jgi:protein transport protein SEC24
LLEDSLFTLQQRQVEQAVDILFNYRRYCASASSAGQLILPEALKLLPLYALALLKHPCFRVNHRGGSGGGGGGGGGRQRAQAGGSADAPRVRADERAFLLHSVLAAPVATSIVSLYPRLHNLLQLGSSEEGEGDGGDDDAAAAAAAAAGGVVGPPSSTTLYPSAEHLTSDGVYLLDCGYAMYVLVGDRVSGDVVGQVRVGERPFGCLCGGGGGGGCCCCVCCCCICCCCCCCLCALSLFVLASPRD